MNSMEEPLGEPAGQGRSSRAQDYLTRVASDERLLGVVICSHLREPLLRTDSVPAVVNCSDTQSADPSVSTGARYLRANRRFALSPDYQYGNELPGPARPRPWLHRPSPVHGAQLRAGVAWCSPPWRWPSSVASASGCCSIAGSGCCSATSGAIDSWTMRCPVARPRRC